MEEPSNDRSCTVAVTLVDRTEECEKLVNKAKSLYPIAPLHCLQEKMSKFEKEVYNTVKSKDEYMRRMATAMEKLETQYNADQRLNEQQETQTLNVQTNFLQHQSQYSPQHDTEDRQRDVSGPMGLIQYTKYNPQGKHQQMLMPRMEAKRSSSGSTQAPGQQSIQGLQTQECQIQSGQHPLSHREQTEYEQLLQLFPNSAEPAGTQSRKPFIHSREHTTLHQSLMDDHQHLLAPRRNLVPLSSGNITANQPIMMVSQQQAPADVVTAKRIVRMSKSVTRGGSRAAVKGGRGSRTKKKEGSTSGTETLLKEPNLGEKTSKADVQTCVTGTSIATQDTLNDQLPSNNKHSRGVARRGRGRTQRAPRKARVRKNASTANQEQSTPNTDGQTASVCPQITRRIPVGTENQERSKIYQPQSIPGHPSSALIEAPNALPKVQSKTNHVMPSQTSSQRSEEQEVASALRTWTPAQGSSEVDGKELASPTDESLWTEIELLQMNYKNDLHKMAPLAETVLHLQPPETKPMFWECLEFSLYIMNLERSCKLPALVTANRLKSVGSFSVHVIAQARGVMQSKNISKSDPEKAKKRGRELTHQVTRRKKQRSSSKEPQIQTVFQAKDPCINLTFASDAQRSGAVTPECLPLGRNDDFHSANISSEINAHQDQEGRNGATAHRICMKSSETSVTQAPCLATLEEAIRHMETSTSFALEWAECLDDQLDLEKAERIKDTFKALRDGCGYAISSLSCTGGKRRFCEDEIKRIDDTHETAMGNVVIKSSVDDGKRTLMKPRVGSLSSGN